MQVVGWHVEVEFEEDEKHTKAAALLRLPDGSAFRAHGKASRRAADVEEQRVGEELAGARALLDLAEQLLARANDEVRELNRT